MSLLDVNYKELTFHFCVFTFDMTQQLLSLFKLTN
jgi:hypothetical protein